MGQRLEASRLQYWRWLAIQTEMDNQWSQGGSRRKKDKQTSADQLKPSTESNGRVSINGCGLHAPVQPSNRRLGVVCAGPTSSDPLAKHTITQLCYFFFFFEPDLSPPACSAPCSPCSRFPSAGSSAASGLASASSVAAGSATTCPFKWRQGWRHEAQKIEDELGSAPARVNAGERHEHHRTHMPIRMRTRPLVKEEHTHTQARRQASSSCRLSACLLAALLHRDPARRHVLDRLRTLALGGDRPCVLRQQLFGLALSV
jgi:hypothetical protein